MMRKVILSFVSALAVIAVTASLASGASPPAHAAQTCGTTYTPACGAPGVTIKSIAACRKAGSEVTFPLAVSANAGIRKIVIIFRGKTIKALTFEATTRTKKLSVTIHTAGLRSGVYSVTVRVTDTRGKTVTKVARFSICKTAAVLPVFTG